MSTNSGPETLDSLFADFSENEKIKFAAILREKNVGNAKKAQALRKALSPDEDDKYDLYLRASERAQQLHLIDTDSSSRKRNKGGCSMM